MRPVFKALRTVSALCALAACGPRARAHLPPVRLRLDVSVALAGPPAVSVTAPRDALAWAPLDDGARAVLGTDGVVRVLDGDRELARRAVLRPSACALRVWGLRALLFCPEEGVVPTAPGLRFERAEVIRDSADRWVLAVDGSTLTHEGPCDGDDGPLDALAACTRDPDGRWRTWQTDAPGTLLDQRGHEALATRCRDGGCEVARFDIDTARWHPLWFRDVSARWVTVGFDGDGDVAGLVRTGVEPTVTWFVHGHAAEALTAVRLPFEVSALSVGGPTLALVGGGGAWCSGDAAHTLRRWGALHATRRDETVRPLDRNTQCARGICVTRAGEGAACGDRSEGPLVENSSRPRTE